MRDDSGTETGCTVSDVRRVEILSDRLRGMVPPQTVRIILDLGARDLSTSIALGCLYPQSQVFAFECHPLWIALCRERGQQSENVKLIPFAAHNTNGRVGVSLTDPGCRVIGLSDFQVQDSVGLADIQLKCDEVEATRLDTWARGRGIHQVDLLCVECNGAELLALNGLGRLLQTVRAVYTRRGHVKGGTVQHGVSVLGTYLKNSGFALLGELEDISRSQGTELYVRQGLWEARRDTSVVHRSRHSLLQPTAMSRKRVAIIFDNRIRPDTTGTYCLKCLKRIAEVTHFLPDENAVPRAGVDLYLQIDDGTSPGVLEGLHPSAYWAIDTHVAYERLLQISRSVDFVFCAQRPAVARMKRDGVSDVAWLPLAADSEAHSCNYAEEAFDVAFIGNVVTAERHAILKYLKGEFPRSFIGRAFGEDWKRVSAQSRVLFNQSIRGDLNMRVFESIATGKPLVTDALPTDAGLEELFEVGKHIVTFDDVEVVYQPTGHCVAHSTRLRQRIEELLSNRELRASVGSQGKALVLAKHTYQQRMQTIIDVCMGKPGQGRTGSSGLRCDRQAAEIEAQSFTHSQTTAKDLTSIVIPCKNALRFTKECLESVAAYSDHPYELILVDNGSDDGTREFFEHLVKAPLPPHCARICALRNDENLGFARAINQGLRASSGSSLLLLNNDVVVSRAWLSGLLLTAKRDDTWGLVGPMTNYTAPPQLVERVPYKTIDEFHRFAAWWKTKEKGIVEETGRLTGFCLFVKRDVLDRIGFLDEGFEVGFFEDDDLCLRATESGYRCLVAREVFVHHYGSRTFELLGINIEKQLNVNYKRFSAKWGQRAKAWKPPSRSEAPHASQETIQ